MRIIRQQTGMTALATILIILLVAFIVFLALRLIPVYLEYFNVVSSVNSLQEVPDLSQKDQATVHELLKRRFEINDVKRVKFDNVEITRSGGKTIVVVTYEARVSAVGNIDLIVSFHKQAEFP
jgi:ABC-type transport system involved in cytochrome bd biosynthesis fused ATPase/permease subunit